MGCGVSNVDKVHDVSKFSEVSKLSSSPPKISIMPTEPISIDRKMPKDYLEPDSAATFTEPAEDDHFSTDEVLFFLKICEFSLQTDQKPPENEQNNSKAIRLRLSQ